MKLETFFEKFDQFADAPDAVAKMRELVLQLAVQGKLVDQKLEDGDAAQLLAAIFRERDARAAKLRTPQEPASVDGDRHSFQIPCKWVWTQLGNIALQIQYGYTASADPTVTEIRMLRITDIQNNRVDWPSVPGCQIEQGEAEKYLLSANDILIARTGGTIGKSFIVPDAPVQSVFASYLIRVTPPRSMVARYLKTFLESPLYWRQLRQMSAGTGQPNVNGQALGRLEIPLPPLAEQKRIVAKVDELMALCDRLEAQQQERERRHAALARASLARFSAAPTPANLQFLFHRSYTIPPADLRKSILTLGVQGKLVPQDAKDEPVKEFLNRLAYERRNKIEGGSTNLPKWSGPIDNQEKPFRLPSSWQWVRLGAIASIKHGFAFASESFTSDTTPFVLTTPGNFHEKGGFRDRGSKTKYYRGSVDPGFIFKPGDLIIPMTEQAPGLLGSPAFIPDDGKSYLHNQRLGKLGFFSESIVPEFAFWFFNCAFFRSALARTCTGMKVRHTSPNRILRVPFPVCPLAEQRRIVAKVDQLMALVDALETQLAASLARGEKLLEAVVGELTTPQPKPAEKIEYQSRHEFLRAIKDGLKRGFDAQPHPLRSRMEDGPGDVILREDSTSYGWGFAMTRAFRKQVDLIDTKLQGRILQAITEITSDPIKPKGDTVKRLSGDWKDYWRYRIGDFRLVYLPELSTRRVTLWAFAARGGIYE